jgi:hypothetical protein
MATKKDVKKAPAKKAPAKKAAHKKPLPGPTGRRRHTDPKDTVG